MKLMLRIRLTLYTKETLYTKYSGIICQICSMCLILCPFILEGELLMGESFTIAHVGARISQ